VDFCELYRHTKQFLDIFKISTRYIWHEMDMKEIGHEEVKSIWNVTRMTGNTFLMQ